MLKIIISHDVDHIYNSDHIFKDLIFPKLWIRSFIELIKQKITARVFLNRIILIFEKRLNRIPEIVAFDRKNKIPSILFFGMDNLLGMSYKMADAVFWIKYAIDNGFDVGVHGVEINDYKKMVKEFDNFKSISKMDFFGIRTHYVRYDTETFKKMSEIGYMFDSSEFNKSQIKLKPPYKIGKMWEFPLYIMDDPIMKGGLEEAKKRTLTILDKSINTGLEYFTFLFHDYYFNNKTYPHYKNYYEWFVNYCTEQNFKFISYKEAINDLE